jgi:hypothetical protein
MELSLGGLIGAMIGSALGAVNSIAIIAYANGWLRARLAISNDAEQARFEERAALMRRGILAANIVLCASIGYWFGMTLGG